MAGAGAMFTAALRTTAAATGCTGLAAACPWFAAVAAALTSVPLLSSPGSLSTSPGEFFVGETGAGDWGRPGSRTFAAAAISVLFVVAASGPETGLFALLAAFAVALAPLVICGVALPPFVAFGLALLLRGIIGLVLLPPVAFGLALLPPLAVRIEFAVSVEVEPALASPVELRSDHPVCHALPAVDAGAWAAACGGFEGAVVASAVVVLASSRAANGGGGASVSFAGVGACSHCEAAMESGALTSDAILGTADPLQDDANASLQPAGQERRAAQTT